MADLVDLQEAAELLGISTEGLVELTGNGKIHGYRDGSSWKFKREDLEAYATEQQSDDGEDADLGSELLEQIEAAADGMDGDDDEDESDATLAGDPLGMEDQSFSLLDDDMEGDGEDSVLITSQDLDALATAEAALKEDAPAAASEDDELQLADDPLGLSDDDEEDGGAETTIMASADDLLGLGGDDDDDDDGDDDGDPEDATIMADAGDAFGLGDGDMSFEMEDDSTIMADVGDQLGLDSLDDGDDFNLGDADQDDDTQLGAVDNFGVTDDELVLGDPGSSDVTLGAAGSGINLESPSDAGISLEDAADLSDGQSTQLELPAADDGLDALGNDTFNLGTPDNADDMSDSGSQVIAISDSVALDADAPTMAGGVAMDPAAAAAVPGLDQLEEVAPGPEAAPAGMAPPMPVEAGYPIFMVMCLMLITLVLVVTGMMMADVVKTMWSWNQGTKLTSSAIMEASLNLLDMN
jgi:excisionase family DNA binding protein